MVNCSILGCKSNNSRRQENIAYHRFPKDPTLRRRWVKATGRFDWQPPNNSRICTRHFETKWLRRTKRGTFLNDGAFPKLFIQNNGQENSINLPDEIPAKSQITHCLTNCNCICHNNKMVVNKVTVSAGTQTIPIYEISKKNNKSTTLSESEEGHVGKEEDEMDEGQEEWLSEGILTDDDYNPAGDQSKADSNLNTSQDSAPSLNEADLNDPKHAMNIEETLDNFQNTNQTELPEELGAFLIRKTDGKVIDSKREESDIDESTKQSDDDGHDTDELLRMLGGEDNSKKDGVKKSDQKRTHESQSSDEDDDEYIFEGAKVARLKVAKNAILKKYPSKAVPEETSDRDTDMSSDEGLTVKRMFGVTRKSNVAAKSTAKSSINALKTVTKKVVNLPKPGDKNPATSTPIQKPVTQTKVVRAEPEEIIDEEEFLDEDQFDLDEELESDAELQQRIMRPEQMDEEVPSDADSHEDNDSLYDELPSSDSDDMNDWFTLDIRSERAGNYIPLLGTKAHQILQAEKQRVSSRLNTLKQSVSALNKSSAQQAEMLRRATLQLAELDAALKA